MGSVLFRDVSVVPEELVFKINYLGREGYERIVGNLMENAGKLEATLTASGRFELLNDSATCRWSSSGHRGQRRGRRL